MQCYELKNVESDRQLLATFLHSWPESALNDPGALLTSSHQKIFVLAVDEKQKKKIIAGLVMSIVAPTSEIIDLYVLEAWRQSGYGTALLKFAVHQLKAEEGVNEIFLEVRPSNTAAISLYQKLGFISFSRRKKYYADGEDALILRKEISHFPLPQ